MISKVGTRLRLRYSKLGKVRFVSHRDGARLWERALRRVELPVAYTEGFTPRPRIGFGLALPTAAESLAEFLDVDLVREADIDVDDERWNSEMIRDLSDALPVGIDVTVIAERSSNEGSLQERVDSVTWELTGPGDHPEPLAVAAQHVLDADELIVERERKGQRRVDDVRPLIHELHPDETGSKLIARLATDGRTLRPAELAELAFAGVVGTDVRVLRTHQWIEDDDGPRELLPLPIDALTGEPSA